MSTQRSYTPLCVPFAKAPESTEDLSKLDPSYADSSGIAHIDGNTIIYQEHAPTTKLDLWYKKYPIHNPRCEDMYEDNPSYHLDYWKAKGTTDKWIPELRMKLKESGIILSDKVVTLEQLANVYASVGVSRAEYQRNIVVETKPILDGTVTVTFEVAIEPMNKCNEGDVPKTVIKSIKDASFTIPKNEQQSSIQFLDYQTDDVYFNAPITFEQTTQSSSSVTYEPIKNSQIYFLSQHQSNEQIIIPEWIKQLSKFWADGSISDEEFIAAVEHLIKSRIIQSPSLSITDEDEQFMASITGEQKEVKVELWVKNIAKWFAEGLIGPAEFVGALEFLVEEEIISSPNIKVIPKIKQSEKPFDLQVQDTETLQEIFESQKWNELAYALLSRFI